MLGKRKGLERSFSSVVVLICGSRGATVRPDKDGGKYSDYRVSASHGEREREKLGETHPDSFHHETDVSDAHEVGALVDGVDGFDVAGDLRVRRAD